MRHDRREAIISARERFIPRAAACGRGFGYAAAGVRARRLIEMVRTATRRRRLGRRSEVWRRDARPPSDSKFPIEKARGQFFWSVQFLPAMEYPGNLSTISSFLYTTGSDRLIA